MNLPSRRRVLTSVLAAAAAFACAFPSSSAAQVPDSSYTGDLVLYPPAPCTEDVITAFVRGYVATPCDSFISAEKVDDHTILIRTQIYSTRECFAAPWQFFSVPVVMGRFPQGTNGIRVFRQTIVRDEIGNRDTVITASMMTFEVTTTCTSSTVPADKLPYVRTVTTIPSPPCPNAPVSIHLAGVFLNGCGRVVSVDPATLSLVLSPYPPAPYPSPTPCTMALEPWSADFPLGLMAAGHHEVALQMTVLGADSLWPPMPTQTYRGLFDFDVPRVCGQTSPLPYVDHISVRPERMCGEAGAICPGENLEVSLEGTFPNSCFHIDSLVSFDPPDASPIPQPRRLRLAVSDQGCRRIACSVDPVSWSRSLVIPGVPAGSYQLRVEEIRTLGCPPVQDLHWASQPFTVVPAESCSTPSFDCLMPSWLSSVNDHCAALISPGDSAQVVLGIRSPRALAGLEGTLHVSGEGARIARLETVGSAVGMLLSWTPISDGVHFVLFAPQGAPIPETPPIAPAEIPILRVMVALAPASRAQRIGVSSEDFLGSDENGIAVPMCPPPPCVRLLPPTAVICVEKGECDYNADGRLDVRDLVLMVHCAVLQLGCPADVTRFDCDGDGQFQMEDVLCCATELLRGPGCPECSADSTRPAPEVTARFGEPRSVDGGLEIPLRIEGAGSIGAARLRLRFPGDRFVVAGIEGAPNWFELHRSSADELSLGLIQNGALSVAAVIEGPLDLTIRLASRLGAPPAGEIALLDAEFSGRDGVRLGVDLGQPGVLLGPTGAVALSTAHPNPFDGVTRFSVQLERAGALDVGVYDLAGRRIATLFRGTVSAGPHPFVWDGRTDEAELARGGVYFYRAMANGHSVTRRIVLLRGK